MSLRGTIGAGLLLAAAVLPARAQTTLEWKFKDGDKFYIEAVTDTKQTVTVGDKTTTPGSTYTTVSSIVVRKADGGYRVEQTIEGVKVKPNKADDPTAVVESRFANQLKGATFKFTISPSGKITSKGVEGYEELLTKLSEGNEAAQKGLRALLPEDALKADLNAMFGVLPDGPIGEGKGWTRSETQVLLWGKLTGQAEYVYKGKVKDGEEITVNRKLTYELPKDAAAGVKVTKADIKVDKATANIVVDPAAGRLVSHTQTTHLAGKLTTNDGSKDTTTDIDQTTTRTLRRVDENPLK
jgi:hypothetical protein